MSEWVPAEKELPGNPRCVLATDSEAHFVACWESGQWWEMSSGETIDSVVTHWMEVPAVPGEEAV